VAISPMRRNLLSLCRQCRNSCKPLSHEEGVAMQLWIGFLAGIGIAALAWRARTLTVSGAIAAAVTGGIIFGSGGIPWAVLLLAFFISSSALSKAFTRRKAPVNANFSKGSQRDWRQVLANGGLGAVLAAIYGAGPQAWAWAAFAGAIASVNADTWATELGVLSRGRPRLITTGELVEAGTSGGVSGLGTLAALGGATLIGGLALAGSGSLALGVTASLGGLIGSLIDSWLGATLQAIYYCPACHKETERHPLHTCGTATHRLRGLPWLDNDWVNAIASLAGSLFSLGGWLILKNLL
jgi:uncharacterized protein (TIGR00297 family)